MSIVSLDDRAADGQPDSHTPDLGGVEHLKKASHGLPVETDACILHAQAHTAPLIWSGSDQQMSRTTVDGAHRVRRIEQQIQNHLLKLNTIAGDAREPVT